ncbi:MULTISPECIES: hypothetical protein [unclassified Dolichospermum]|uniref:hypothetical protein n=1 Tax=unclassified Dolichospermum TaxID=2622029 RepID=UPI00144733C9|nr:MULTISPECIES: hypothetical protein [unclassified Dolichospermum]MTJ16501.1 hypothetical protein [Dolichospermum sp. UHCC 0299]MTJ38675.1 hypothetical protein [Dolichospermum sp. UHCC 0406]
MLGKIVWFGGFNKNENRVNDFGFITLLDGDNTEGIYLHRDNVPVDVQTIIESPQGKGVYVEFEIDSTRNRATDLKIAKFIGTVDRSKTGICRIKYNDDCEIEFRIIDYFNNLADILYFKNANVIYFSIKEERNKKIPILLEDINKINDEEIILKCVNSKIFSISKKFLAKYLLLIPLDIAENYIIDKLDSSDYEDQDDLIDEIFRNAPNILLSSYKIRSYFNLMQCDCTSYIDFINQYIDIVEESLQQQLIKELINKLQRLNDHERSIYWNKVEYLNKNLEYNNFLWEIAPLERKIIIIRERFKKILEIISRFQDSEYPYAADISDSRHELYKLNELENMLIIKWDSSVIDNEFKSEKMISARGAEKLVMQFYQKLGYEVEDISIHQVTQQSQDWKKGDIRLNSTELLDVKNSRKSNKSHSYSEFCVPSFKEFRNHDVTIVGVLSPYLRNDADNPKILGSFDKTQLIKIEEIFSDRFIKIDMPRNNDINRYLPPWVFDYNERFYQQQYQILTELQNLHDQDIPSWEDISSVAQNFLPVFIAAKRPLPKSWLVNLPKWQVEFIKGLIELPPQKITLPYLFLSILKHFLSMLSYQGSDYNPQKYLEIICTTSSKEHPLKIYDPLNMIKDFCETLDTLWNNRDKDIKISQAIFKLTDFKIFTFIGKEWLKGQRSESDTQTTILVYCGGTIKKNGKYNGKCGFRYLVIGKHQNCPKCGCLICEKCGYCSYNCSKTPPLIKSIQQHLNSDDIPF